MNGSPAKSVSKNTAGQCGDPEKIKSKTSISNYNQIMSGDIEFMPTVIVKKDEPLEKALYRFRKICNKAEIMEEAKDRAAYKKPSKRRSDKKYRAIVRMKKMQAKKNREKFRNEPL